MTSGAKRVFKTAWFAKASKKARITDDELCTAILQVMLGQADDLGGGIYKKRLSKNQYRSIILARGQQYWVYAYLFAKQDRADIEDDELVSFRALAGLYARKTEGNWPRKCNSNNSWRYAMKSNRKYKSDAFEAIHSAAAGMYRAGTIDKETMRGFDESCLT